MTDTALPPTPPLSASRVLEAVRAALGDLVGTLWATRPPEELLAVVRECERVRSALDAVQLAVIAEVDATNAARSEEWASTRDFVTAVTGGHRGTGRRLVQLARAVATDRAATGAALACGDISRTQAEVVMTAIEHLPVSPGLRDAAEEVLIEEARFHDASDLRDRARRIVARLDPDGDERRDERALRREERAAHAGRFLSIAEDGLGGVRVRGRGTIEEAAYITTALAPLSAPRPPADAGACGGSPGSGASCGVADCAHDGRDPRDHGARTWDALVEGCRLLAGTDVLPTSHGVRPRVAVVVPVETLCASGRSAHAGGSAGPARPPDRPTGRPEDPHAAHQPCHTEDDVQVSLRAALGEAERPLEGGLLDPGGRLSVSALRRLACDADVLPCVLGSRSEVLDVGRTQRLVTSAIWLALVLRDRHCAFPGCSRPPIACDAHHVVHWADGGSTSLDNLVLLCRTHHTVLHTTPWDVRLDPVDRRPEFLPPTRLDPHQRPLRHRPMRE